MKNKILLIIIGVIACLIFVIGGLFVYKKVNVVYTVIYNDMYIPGSKSEILVYSDRVKIITTQYCSAIDCDDSTEVEIFDYSKKNLEKLIKFISDNFSGNYIEINRDELTDKQQEVIQSILLGEYFFESTVEDYKYKILYSENNNSSYNIYFKSNGSILVKRFEINDSYDIVGLKSYELAFSEESVNILNKYIEREVKNKENNVINKNGTLRKDEKNIFECIIKNDDSYLNDNTNVKLSYTILFTGVNCLTPVLYLYDDNTFEYFDKFTSSGNLLIPKTGTYDYDIKKLFNNSGKNDDVYYTIRNFDDEDYVISSGNIDLMNFLNSLGVSLNKCLSQQ